jgi:hypothetical protein
MITTLLSVICVGMSCVKSYDQEAFMELSLLLLPIAVLFALGWTHFPAITCVFVLYLGSFVVRWAYRSALDRPTRRG